MPTSVKRLVFALAFFPLVLAALSGCAQDSAPANKNILFGVPGQAKADAKSSEAFLIERPQYVLSYNDKTKTPNWVSWRLIASDIGKVHRGAFEADNSLPAEFGKVQPQTYTSSGFDRGHMCNSKDRSDNVKDNDATFLMTNMVPQAPFNNQRTWEHLEDYCRELALQGNELHIVAGPHGVGGTGKNGFKTKIGTGNLTVTVPSHVWKVVLVLEKPGAQVTKRTRTIAVIVPNDQHIDADWTKYRVSVEDVEETTGLKFFPQIPDAIASVIKVQVDADKVDMPAKEPR